jgi:N-acetylglucosamine-6-phosphate deacetylase
MVDHGISWLRGALVGPRRVLEDRLVRLEDGRIAWIGRPVDDASGARAARPIDGLIAPALLDVHCHGGGGNDVLGPGVAALAEGGPEVVAATVEALRAFAAFQSSRGVTAVLPTAVSLPLPALRTWLLAVAEARRRQQEDAAARQAVLASGRRQAGWAAWPEASILGANLEGPALADARRGAHDPRAIVPPRALLDLVEAEPGLFDPVRIVTVAPEGSGGMELVSALEGRGIVASLGHTAADTGTILAAVAAGAESTTHLFNAMPPLHHRDPGLPGVALAGPELRVELIADGVHVHPMLFAALARAVGDRLVLVSDAIAAAGYGDGELDIGGLHVTVRGAEARLDDGTLAGSVTPLDIGLVRAIEAGVPLPAAVHAAATAPARLIGARDRGALRAGMRADLVVLDEAGRVRATCLAGGWLEG